MSNSTEYKWLWKINYTNGTDDFSSAYSTYSALSVAFNFCGASYNLNGSINENYLQKIYNRVLLLFSSVFGESSSLSKYIYVG